MGLQLKYFYSLTAREFFNTVKGFRKREENLSNERLLMTRKMMWASAMAHYKNLKETDLMALDFIDNLEHKKTEEETLQLIAEAEKVKQYYLEQDKKQKSQTI